MNDRRSAVGMGGWLAAAVLLGALLTTGFQAPANSLKLGVVDVNRVIEKSDYGQEGSRQLAMMKKSRQDILEFVDTYRVLTPEQASRIRDLGVKSSRSKEEEAELERLKSDVIAANKRLQELSTKSNLTPEERTLIEEYARRSQMMNEQATRWLREFTDEISTWVDARKAQSYERARAAVTEIAAKEAYTMVFEGSVAPYGANDVSDAALAAMNAKK